MNNLTTESNSAPLTMQLAGRFGGGGAQKIAFLMADGMVQRGIPAIAVSVHALGELIENPREGLQAIDLGLTGGSPIKWYAASRRLRKIIREQEPQMVHAHSCGSLLLAAAAVRGLKRPPVLWFTWHIPDTVLTETGLRRSMLKWSMKRCQRIFGDSQAIIDELTGKVPALTKMAAPFRHGVDERPQTPAQDDPHPRILWCARMAPSKDSMAVVNAARTLRDEGLDFSITLAGSAMKHHDWYEAKTRDAVKEAGLEDRIALPGWIRDVDGLFDTHNIAVQSSHAEGLSVSLLEQMMAGMAIVATDVGDTRYALEDGQHGIIIQHSDEEALTDALRRMVTDASFRQDMAARARARALDHFTTEAMCTRTLAMLDEDLRRMGPSQ